MLLHDAFDASCARLPAKTAIVCGSERVSYGELAARIDALASLLKRRGVQRGDRIALFLEAGVEFAVAVLAGEPGVNFLGAQGDEWDAQWDMFFCMVGATLAVMAFWRLQDRQIGRGVDEGGVQRSLSD